MSQIINDIESAKIIFKPYLPISVKHFVLSEITSLAGDGEEVYSTNPKPVNKSISLGLFDEYTTATVVDLKNVTTVMRYKNEDIVELSWSKIEKEN